MELTLQKLKIHMDWKLKENWVTTSISAPNINPKHEHSVEFVNAYIIRLDHSSIKSLIVMLLYDILPYSFISPSFSWTIPTDSDW